LLTHGWFGVCERSASQATSQNKHEAPRCGLGDVATAAEKERYLRDLEGWMAGQSGADGHDEAGDEEEDGEAAPLRRVANMHWCIALDHALMSGIGRPLAAFMPKLRLQRLGKDEIRHFVDDADLREGGQAGVRRACVYNRVTEAGFVEMPREYDEDGEEVFQPELVLSIDQGTIGHPSVFWLYTHLGLGGFWVHDPWHRIWNDLKGGLVGAGVWPVVLEMIVVMNTRAGPFESSAFFQTIKGAMEEMARVSGDSNPFFQSFYEGICFDWNLTADMDFGTREHQRKVWRLLAAARCFKVKGTLVKWGRWCSFFDVGNEFRQNWSALLPAMFSHGFRSGWWSCVDESPLCGDARQDAALAGGLEFVGSEPSRAQGSEAAAPRTVKESNRAIKHIRSEHRNTLHLASSVLANFVTKRLFLMILEVCEPVRADMGLAMSAMGESRRGGLEMYLSWAKGEYNQVMARTWATLVDADVLRRCMFNFPASSAPCVAEPLLVEEDNELASRMLLLVRNVVGVRCTSMLEYSHSIPILFVLLLDDDEAVVEKTLAKLRGIWAALGKVESMGLRDPWFAKFADKLVWPQLTTVRALFVSLEEAQWEVSSAIRDHLGLLFGGILHTKPIEEVFNYLADNERKAKSKKLSTLLMWHLARQSPILEQWGYRAVARTAASDLAACQKLPANLCESDAEDFSIGGRETLLSLQNAGWRSPSPANFALIPFATEAMLRAASDPNGLRQTWPSLLAEPGAVVWKVGDADKTCSIVLRTTVWGFLAWPLRSASSRDAEGRKKGYYKVVTEGPAAQPVLHTITDVAPWRVSRFTIASPLEIGAQFPAEARPLGLVLMHKSSEPLLQYAASVGFRSLTLPNLQKLVTLGKVPLLGKRPTTVQGTVMLLLRHIFPNKAEEELVEFFKRRDLPDKPVVETTLAEGENSKLAADYLEPEEMADVLKIKATTAAKAKGRDASCSATAASSRGSAPTTSAASSAGADSSSTLAASSLATDCPDAVRTAAEKAAAKGPMSIDWGGIEIDAVRRHMPTVQGLTVGRELKLANRWRVCYPRAALPKSFSQVYADLESEKLSVLACLRWAWAAHEKETTERCPWSDLYELAPECE
jgi:hypothetical protein